MLLFKIAGIGIAVALLVSVLKQAGRDDIGQTVALVGVLTVLLMTAQLLYRFFNVVNFTFLNH
ncbi:MAG TPA: stage III sporulation protein AC [Symbiobacteriaceae bacterium]|jgi:stage III sporulation protein AC